MLSTDDYGRDLASVQALQRKHEGVERDLAALEEKVSHNLTAILIGPIQILKKQVLLQGFCQNIYFPI